jgi:hypothetical protein
MCAAMMPVRIQATPIMGLARSRTMRPAERPRPGDDHFAGERSADEIYAVLHYSGTYFRFTKA